MGKINFDKMRADGSKAGWSLPRKYYKDPDVFEREKEAIIYNNWVFAGHVSQIPETGDYFLFNLLDESAIIVRTNDGSIAAYYNVCLHRGSHICKENSGNAKRFLCPYHAWSYDLDGSLFAARGMPESFDKSEINLHECAIDFIEDMIFVNFSDNPTSLKSAKRDLAPALEIFDFKNMKVAAHKNYPIAANWKITLENYQECYHCAPSHPEYALSHTLKYDGEKYDQLQKPMLSRMEACGIKNYEVYKQFDAQEEGQEQYSYSRYALFEKYKTGSEDGKPLAPLLGNINGYDHGASDFGVGPLTWMLAYNDHVVVYVFTPTSHETSACDQYWLVRSDAEEGVDYDLERLTWLSAYADPMVQLGLLGLVAVVALGSGAHPAFQLSSFRPGTVLGSTKPGQVKSSRLQVVLVTLQFTISIALIIATVVVYSQINFAKSAGNSVISQNKLAIIDFANQSFLEGPLRARLNNLPGVTATSLSGRLLPLPNYWNSQVILPGQQGDENYSLEALPGHFDTLSFFDAKLLAGRLFSTDFMADLPAAEEGALNSTRSGIINETAIAQLGYADAQDAIGNSFQFKNFTDEGYALITIVGVVQDMNMRSVRDPISPMLFLVQEDELNFLNVELSGEDRAGTLLAIDEIWQSLAPDRPIRRSFLDESFSRLYETDARRGEFFAYFSIFAVFVSLIGLFGLSALAVERRSREIGIRKVLGASVLDIVRLLSLQFSKPVVIANFISWPLVAYFMNDWLSGFAYRIDLNPLYFIGTGLLVLFFAVLIVALQALRGARVNPIKMLRHE
ncbi:MAG: Rieske 2Fe-2S domain-containing protein [Kordiimonadaceae bacterium]|nr:Rieske 2Fe-2S domain-containing protein [Kordiimonadaceae bacterium]MBT6034932.1 Rieske 2Fe-2S domain-containing protein [Kordiimonadaceae bacterium]MBT6328816.1 Rieske 2Fe-2S domain-containing protein [Kordiimonadaceae bacterium]